MGSIEFGAERYGKRLFVVLGHSNCAEALAGNQTFANEHLAKATQLANNITKAENRKLLEADFAAEADYPSFVRINSTQRSA